MKLEEYRKFYHLANKHEQALSPTVSAPSNGKSQHNGTLSPQVKNSIEKMRAKIEQDIKKFPNDKEMQAYLKGRLDSIKTILNTANESKNRAGFIRELKILEAANESLLKDSIEESGNLLDDSVMEFNEHSRIKKLGSILGRLEPVLEEFKNWVSLNSKSVPKGLVSDQPDTSLVERFLDATQKGRKKVSSYLKHEG